MPPKAAIEALIPRQRCTSNPREVLALDLAISALEICDKLGLMEGSRVKTRRIIKDMPNIKTRGPRFLRFGEFVATMQVVLPPNYETYPGFIRQGYEEALIIFGYNEFKQRPQNGELLNGEYRKVQDIIPQLIRELLAAYDFLKKSGKHWGGK